MRAVVPSGSIAVVVVARQGKGDMFGVGSIEDVVECFRGGGRGGKSLSTGLNIGVS